MITRLFKRLYKILDKFIITPISRAVYFFNKKFKNKQGKLDKLLNKPHFLVYLSLLIAVIFFLLIDSKVINLVETDAEVITNVPVVVKYNEEAYVVEGVPETVDITITGRKSDIYLAKQLGEYEVILDLSEYTPSETPYKVKFTYSKSINSLSYKLDPSYVQVTIKNKESEIKPITSDLLNISSLDNTLSVKSVTLKQQEVVVKGGSDDLEKVASVKALVDFKKEKAKNSGIFTAAGSYDIDSAELVAYDSNGNKLKNIEIVPSVMSATVVLSSDFETVKLDIETIGDLVPGKAIASILINGSPSYDITVYGEKEDIKGIKVPVTIDVTGLGNESTKTYNATINKPNGVRQMSTDKVTITVTFGEEQQKTVTMKTINPDHKPDNLKVIQIDEEDLTVQLKGVASVLDGIQDGSVQGYVDVANLGVGEHEVEVKIKDPNPLIKYVVSRKMKIAITEN